MNRILFIVAIFSVISIGNAKAQTGATNSTSHTIAVSVPTVAIVNIEPTASKNITMNFVAPTVAGSPISAPNANNELWLNYSFIPSAKGKTANVAVAIDVENTNYELIVQAAAPATGNSGGSLGTSADALTLSTNSQNLITGIGASYTGTGVSSGHNLTYSIKAQSSAYSTLVAAALPEVTVTYTISEQ